MTNTDLRNLTNRNLVKGLIHFSQKVGMGTLSTRANSDLEVKCMEEHEVEVLRRLGSLSEPLPSPEEEKETAKNIDNEIDIDKDEYIVRIREILHKIADKNSTKVGGVRGDQLDLLKPNNLVDISCKIIIKSAWNKLQFDSKEEAEQVKEELSNLIEKYNSQE